MQRLKLSALMLALAATLLLTAGLAAAQTPNLEFTIPRISQAPVINGDLSDNAWVQASQRGGKTVVDLDHLGVKLTPYPRVAYLAYDDTALYLAVVAYVPDPSTLVTDLPAASNNDEIELFLAPDSSGYHQFIVTAGSGLQHNTRGSVRTDVQVEYAVQVSDIKWTVELAVPFEALGVKPSAGDSWTFNINGRQVGPGDQWLAWNPTYGGFHNPDRFGTLIFGE